MIFRKRKLRDYDKINYYFEEIIKDRQDYALKNHFNHNAFNCFPEFDIEGGDEEDRLLMDGVNTWSN